ncbi:unnamed protein product [Chilo suppressalis]|uniref:Uncharacterized protein n=1 Tax=Chilo suppressalis TaxID=168631 RepID=A0ABN8BBC1_CHISP|nr:unnamed protein product [Chilo suppressalis]
MARRKNSLRGLSIEDLPSVNGSENNPVLEVEDNLNHARPPLIPVINNVLLPTGEVNYDGLPSLALLLSVTSSNASSIAIPSASRTTRHMRKLLLPAVPNYRAKKTKKTIEDLPSVNGSENNPVLEVEDNLNHARPPLIPVINNVLLPTGEVNYDGLPSLALLLSVTSSNASSIAIPSASRTTRHMRKLLLPAVPNYRAKKTKKTFVKTTSDNESGPLKLCERMSGAPSARRRPPRACAAGSAGEL